MSVSVHRYTCNESPSEFIWAISGVKWKPFSDLKSACYDRSIS